MTIYSCFIALIFSLCFISCQKVNKEQSDKSNTDKQRPNIILLLADDLGYNDLNCYGGIPETGNIDKIARNGLKFTHFYAPSPNCSPSRAGLLTGRNPNRVGIYSYRKPDHSMHLIDKEITIAELLKKNGYKTALFGKWHLGDLTNSKQPTPSDQGFDYWLATENNAYPSHYNPVNFVRNGKRVDTIKGYSCHILVNQAKKWLNSRNNKAHPFFLYMPFHEVHKKIAAPDSLIEKYKKEKDSVYQATVENMDHAVGKLIKYLKSKNEFENTLIIYSSDNGSYRHGSNGRLRGYKGESYEGGVRVPCIIHWPSKIKKHRIISEPAGLIDLLPTICDITNTKPPKNKKLDGINLMPLLNNKKFYRSKPLFWFFYRASPEAGLRDGKYLLNAYTKDSLPRTHHFTGKDMRFIKKAKFKKFKLYNLHNDPAQKHNISEKRPQIKDSLVQKFRRIFHDIQKNGYEWNSLPQYNEKHAEPKRQYMRNKNVRWDWE